MVFRFGFKTGLKPKKTGEKRIWIHALSVGEVKSAIPFVKELKEQHENLKIVFTASTKTGFDMAKQLLLDKHVRLADQLGYFPLDLGYCVKKISRLIQPDAVVIVETELWPNFLYEMQKKQIPVVLINARLSQHSLNGYLFFKRFFSRFFSSLAQIMVQTSLDEERFLRLNISKDKICVVGNIKFDQYHEDMDKTHIDSLRERLGIQKASRVLVAGSTHEGEEIILCEVYEKLRMKYPGLMMILAPRDPKRCGAISTHYIANNIHAAFMSAIDKSKQGHGVVLVDKMGELSRLYAICDVAFIGGSIVKQGGHNPLEPAAFSKPILFGSDMSDFLLMSKLLMDNGGTKKVESKEDLIKELETLLGNQEMQKQMGRRNFEVFSENSGAVKRIIQNMERLHLV